MAWPVAVVVVPELRWFYEKTGKKIKTVRADYE